MGRRSWLSPVYSELDYKKVIKFAETYNDGVYYVIQITKEGKHPWKLGDVIVAWEGDGSSSIYGLKPDISYNETRLLDVLLDHYPAWHSGKKGPEKFGKFIKRGESPNWSLVVKPKKFKKFDSSFSDLIFTVYYKMIYHNPTSGFDSNDNFNFYFYDANGILFKVTTNEITKKTTINKLNAPNDVESHKIHEFDKENKRIFISDKLAIKQLIKYLKSKPEQSFLDYLETNQLI
jgi:hypothetical protein